MALQVQLQLHGPRLASRRSRQLKPCQATTAELTARLSHKQTVSTEIEKTSWTSRKLFAAVPINAPVPVVWACLTDYEGLSNFIPSLIQNKCLERRPNGAVIRQVGAQEVAMGVAFSAACTLDCTEYPVGVSPHICSTSGDGTDGLLPYPRTSLQGVTSCDITFEQLEGDFQAFRGIWRMQPLQVSANSSIIRTRTAGAREPPHATLLSYSLYVQPKPWLPVGLIQDRIEKEVKRNLEAVRRHAERMHTQRALFSMSNENSQ